MSDEPKRVHMLFCSHVQKCNGRGNCVQRNDIEWCECFTGYQGYMCEKLITTDPPHSVQPVHSSPRKIVKTTSVPLHTTTVPIKTTTTSVSTTPKRIIRLLMASTAATTSTISSTTSKVTRAIITQTEPTVTNVPSTVATMVTTTNATINPFHQEAGDHVAVAGGFLEWLNIGLIVLIVVMGCVIGYLLYHIVNKKEYKPPGRAIPTWDVEGDGPANDNMYDSIPDEQVSDDPINDSRKDYYNV